ncbi:hypothetical protein AOLI_G00128850 [Acnodon oligacanthus]
MKFEDILAEIGGFGRFQKLIVFLIFVSRITLPCHFLLINYIGAIPSHHCDIGFLDAEGVFGNLTQEQKLTVSIPKNEDGMFASCHMFAEPQFQLLDTESNFTNVPLIQCPNGWEYDNSTFISTLSTQWDLVCEKRGMTKAVATIFFVGVMFGAAMFGSLSDRYGRRVMLLVSYIVGMTFAVASVFSSSFAMFAVLRFFTGLGLNGIVIITSVLNVEWVDIERRKLVGVIESMSWAFGYMVLPIFAYGVRDWKWLTITVTSPLVIAIISWRYGVASTYYGISFNIKGFGLDLYLTQFLYGFVELPTKILVYLLLDQIGRNKTEVGSLLLVGSCLLVNVFITKDQWIVRTVIGVLGKGFASMAFSTLVLYSSELYPTVIRQNGMGYNSFLGRLGVAIAPMILLLDEVWGQLSQVILCAIALITALVAYQLPETRGRCLPETIEDVEGSR